MRLASILLALAVVSSAAYAEPRDALTERWFNGDVHVQLGSHATGETPWQVDEHTAAEVGATAKKLFGKAMSTRELAAVMGAPDGSKMVVTIVKPDQLVVFVENAKLGLKAERWILDGPHIYNQEIRLADDAPAGMGTRILAHQVAAARALGITRIDLSAARTEHRNGYYTWPRLGFDGDLPDYAKQPAELGEARTLSEAMSTPQGRAWWKAHGETVSVGLTLHANASGKGEHDHTAYLAEKHVAIGDGLLATRPVPAKRGIVARLARATR